MSTIKLRGKINFPANVTATGGLQVVKTNGIWTVSPSWGDLALITSLATPETKEIWARDPVTDTYYRIAVSAVIASLPAGATGATGATGPAAWTTPAAWLTATAYVAGPPASAVIQGGETYVCLVSHTSGVFATDLAALKWVKVAAKGADGTIAGSTGVTDNRLLRSDGTGGTTLQNSAVTVDDAGAMSVGGVPYLTAGKQTIFIPANAMRSRPTNGATPGAVEQATNKNVVTSLDFDTTTQQFAQFSVWLPKSWNLGTVTFQPCFSQLTTAAGGVVFGLAGVAVSDGDALDVAFGTAQTSTKTAGTANLEYQGPESAAITIAGTPAAGDRVMLQINRTVADASDALAQNARLHGIRLFFTTNAATDT